MEFETYMNDFLHPRIKKNFQDLQNHFDLVQRLEKSFYFKTDGAEDEILTNESLPLTEVSVELFEKAIEELSSNGTKDGKKFNLRYATRISRKACVSPYCFILALIYIKRLKKINPTYVKSQSTCDLFLISLVVSSKFLYEENTDEEIFNCEWAKISGIHIKTLNKMEIDFLFNLNWQVYISALEFMDEWIKIENLVIKKECKKRSFSITYNEIIRIFENDKIFQKLVSNFLTYISKFILIASFTYSSAIISLVLLSRSTILQNGLIYQNLISNQSTYYGNYYNLGQNEKVIPDENIKAKSTELNEGQENDIEELNKSFDSELSSKTLNLKKLNNLDLKKLNNKLNIFKTRLEDVNTQKFNNIYSIKGYRDKKCNFNQFTIQPFRNLFLDYKVY